MRVFLYQIIRHTRFKTLRRKSRRHRGAVKRIPAAGHDAATLPHASGHGVLKLLACAPIASYDDCFSFTVVMQQMQLERVAVVEMPDFIKFEPVKAGKTQRILTVKANDGGACRVSVSAGQS